MTTAGPGRIDGLDRFRALWQRCLIAGANDAGEQIHQRLTDAYNEPQRHYHTLAHIRHCLQQLDLCRTQLDNPDAVEISIWFHDAIYQPGKPENEKRSAQLYRELTDSVHETEFCQQVDEMIIATTHAGESPGRADSLYMVDIDLSSFGLPWDGFIQDGRKLRLECPQLSDEEYYPRQVKFQKSLLARERFYQTEYFYQLYEAQARNNLARYFEHLGIDS